MRNLLLALGFTLLAGVFSGCAGANNQAFGHKSMGRLEDQVHGYWSREQQRQNDFRTTWERYLEHEEKNLHAVEPQFEGYLKNQRRDWNDFLVTLRNWYQNQ